MAHANLLMKCGDGVALEACADKVEQTLINLGCEIKISETDCDFGLIDDPNSDEPDANIQTDTPLCSIKSVNCSQALDVLFSFRESCHESQVKMTIPKASGVTHNYWKGFWGSYSRVICKNK